MPLDGPPSACLTKEEAGRSWVFLERCCLTHLTAQLPPHSAVSRTPAPSPTSHPHPIPHCANSAPNILASPPIPTPRADPLPPGSLHPISLAAESLPSWSLRENPHATNPPPAKSFL